MKFATFAHAGREQVGIVDERAGRVIRSRRRATCSTSSPRYDALKSGLAPQGDGIPLAEVKLKAPIPRPARNIFCVGKNYREHAKEFAQSRLRGQRGQGRRASPTTRSVFTKAPRCVIADPATTIRYPAGVSDSSTTRPSSPSSSARAGATSPKARRLRPCLRLHDRQRRDGARPAAQPQAMVPRQVARRLLPDGAVDRRPPTRSTPENLDVKCWVNGELRQDANTRDLIFDIPTLIADDLGRADACSRATSSRPARRPASASASTRRSS